MLWSKQKYKLLQQDEESSNSAPAKLNSNLTTHDRELFGLSRHMSLQTACVLALLILVIIIQQLYLRDVPHPVLRPSSTELDLPRNFLYRGHDANRFFSENETETNLAWEGIRAGHGAVALDPSWSKSHHIPETMRSPLDESSGIYFIAAYHGIHCLQYLRRHYRALMRGDVITWSVPHDMHCFDSLRQQIMCHADDTILYSGGHRDVGHGQARLCKSWDALREWATERTACYWDLDYPATETRWGRCDGGDDGLPRGSLM